jgi:sterol 24-C-methyltransferase
MAPARLEAEDHKRDAAFSKAMHGTSSQAAGGLTAMRRKDAKAQKAAVDEYFKHWDNKSSETENEEIREASIDSFYILFNVADICTQARRAEYATLTRQ